jgi:hypothetical protein
MYGHEFTNDDTWLRNIQYINRNTKGEKNMATKWYIRVWSNLFKRLWSSTQRQEQLWIHPVSYSMGTVVPVPWGKAIGAWNWPLTSSRIEVKNEWASLSHMAAWRGQGQLYLTREWEFQLEIRIYVAIQHDKIFIQNVYRVFLQNFNRPLLKIGLGSWWNLTPQFHLQEDVSKLKQMTVAH